MGRTREEDSKLVLPEDKLTVNDTVVKGNRNICECMRNHQEGIAIKSAKCKIDEDDFIEDPVMINYELNADYPVDGSELEPILKDLKCNKAAGPNDKLKSEIYKYGGSYMAIILSHLFNCYKRNKCIDDRLRTGCALMLYKNKGARDDPNNYRGITLLDIVAKYTVNL